MGPQEERKIKRTTPNKIKGMIFVLIAWVFFTVVIALSKTASFYTSVPTVLLFQYGVSTLMVLPWVIRERGKGLQIQKYRVIILRSLLGFLSYAFINLAIQRTSLVNVVLLSNSAPLFIPLIIWFWKKVKIGKRLWVGIGIGFLGIALILKPTQEIFNYGTIFGLGAALCMAVSVIAQRRLVKSEAIHSILFYYFLISTICSIPFVVNVWVPMEPKIVALHVGIGILFSAGQLFFLSSLKYEKPSFLSSFNYSAVVYGAIIEWFFWGNFPGWVTILGILVVITGGIITITQTKGKKITGILGKDRSLR